MKIDKIRFKEQFLALMGKEPDIVLPDTLEELLTTQNDPDEFHMNLEGILLTIQQQLINEGGIDTIHVEKYEPNTDYAPLVFLGNVKIKGDFYVNKHTYVVGNLEVEGVIYGDIDCILVVGRDINCEGILLCTTYVFVNGNINIRQCSLAICDGFIMLKGTLSSPVYVQDDTHIVCDINEQAYEVEETASEKIITDHFLEEEDFGDPDFVNEITAIFGQNNIKLDDDDVWNHEELFILIGEQKKVIK